MECEAEGRVGLGWAPKAQHSKNDEVSQPLSAKLGIVMTLFIRTGASRLRATVYIVAGLSNERENSSRTLLQL